MLKDDAVLLRCFAVIVMGTSSALSNAQAVSESALERNERSTPRSFVLPSSPAISTSQDRGRYSDHRLVLKAQLALIALGYDLGRPEGVVTAPMKAALFRFQISRGLAATGDVDQETIRALGVSSDAAR